jgi:hypothetical protein
MHFPLLHGLPGLSDLWSPCQDLELQEALNQMQVFVLWNVFFLCWGAMVLGPRLHCMHAQLLMMSIALEMITGSLTVMSTKLLPVLPLGD